MARKRTRAKPSASAHTGTGTTTSSKLHNDHDPLLPLNLPTTISSLDDAFAPTIHNSQRTEADETMDLSNLSRKGQWITLAVASGACAAFNGVFAKLTTTELTTTFATWTANLLGLGKGEKAVEVVIRAMFFGLNLIFNGIMWALFTKALARGTSTTQVSIINTSANFMITAILGFFIFTESLPPLWWLGAALLVAGNVIIGRREEAESPVDARVDAESGLGHGRRHSGEEEEEELLGDSVELTEAEELEAEAKRRHEEIAEEDILDLGEEDTPHPSQQATSSRY